MEGIIPWVMMNLALAIALAEGGGAAPIHAAVQLADPYIVEAVWPDVRLMPVSSLPADVDRYPLTLTDEQAAALTANLLARVGRERYSVRQLAIDAIGLATHRWLPAPVQECDCSGLVASGLVAVGVLTTMPRLPEDITPADLGRWAAAGMPADLGALLTNVAPAASTTTTVTVTTTPEQAA